MGGSSRIMRRTMERTMSLEELRLVKQIAARAAKLYADLGEQDVNPVYIEAEISACHVHVCPLRLKDFAEADDVNFSHDIGGIHRHLNMKKRLLEDCFLPRFAKLGRE
jgi:hypothetical protein